MNDYLRHLKGKFVIEAETFADLENEFYAMKTMIENGARRGEGKSFSLGDYEIVFADGE